MSTDSVSADMSTTMGNDVTPEASPSDAWKNALFITIGTVGVLSNGFVILVILKTKRMRKIYSNWFVMNQSIIDFIASVFVILDTTNRFNVFKTYEGIGGLLACKFWMTGYLMWSTFVASIYNLISISLERYLCVCHPLWHHQRFRRPVAVAFLALPWLTGLGIEMFLPVLSYVQNDQCMLYNAISRTDRIVQGILLFFINYLIPLVAMVLCYVAIALKIRSMPLNSDTSKKRASEINILKTFVIVCTCYALSMMISQVNFLCFNLGLTVDLFSWYFYAGIVGVNLNCCVNPFIYAFQYEAFKSGMRQLFSRSKGQVQPSEGSGSTK